MVAPRTKRGELEVLRGAGSEWSHLEQRVATWGSGETSWECVVALGRKRGHLEFARGAGSETVVVVHRMKRGPCR